MINQKRLLGLLKDLIAIDSMNPPGNERPIADFVVRYLKGMGLAAKVYEFKKGRANVLASIRGKNPGKTLLITPHLDTVPSGTKWKTNPLRALVRGGRLYGLGATDCKGNLACALEAMHSLCEEKVALEYTLLFAATADEESGSVLGLEPLLQREILKPTVALVLDTDDFEIVVAQKGLLHLTVKLQGTRAHGAYPDKGINAIDAAVRILAEIKDSSSGFYRRNLTVSPRSPALKYLKPPTVNIGTIRGGDKVNIVADWCEFELDHRFLPGMSAERFLKDLREVVRKHSRQYVVESQGIQQPFSIDIRHPLVTGLADAMRRMRVQPVLAGSEGATTISFFQHYGIDSVATGFGSGGCAHLADEYVALRNILKGARVLEQFLKTYHV